MNMLSVLKRIRKALWTGRTLVSRRKWSRSLELEILEDRTLLSTIVWVDRNDPANRFDAVFGSRAELARGVVDGVIRAWQNVIQSFNYSAAFLNDTLQVSISMDAGPSGEGGQAGPTNHDGDGKPTRGFIHLGTSSDGHGSGWFLDPTPDYSEEFRGDLAAGEGMGSTINAYAALATPGGPAAGKSDFYSVVAHELGHVVGIGTTNSMDRYLFPLGGATDGHAGPEFGARLDGFKSPNVQTLITGLAHVAAPALANALPTAYYGVDDLMNPFFYSGSERKQISNLDALILSDTYGYTINAPTNHSTYINFDPGTDNLLVRGGSTIQPVYSSEYGPSDDVISVGTVGPNIVVTVTIGNPMKGTGPNPTYSGVFPTSRVSSIIVKAGTGDDQINIGAAGQLDFLPPVFVDGGSGTDVLTVEDDGSSANGGTYTVTAGAVQRTGTFGGVTYANVERLELNTGTAATTVNVQSTSANTLLTINAGVGSDLSTVNVGNAGSLSEIKGNLTINIPHSYTRLTIDDSADTSPNSVTITNAGITGLAPAAISYSQSELTALTIKSGTPNPNLGQKNVFNVLSTPNLGPVGTVKTTLISRSSDTVNVGNAGSLAGIQGDLVLGNSDAYATAINVNGSTEFSNRTVAITNAAITGLAPAAIRYDQAHVQALDIDAGGERAVISVFGGSIIRSSSTFNVLSTPNIGPDHYRVTTTLLSRGNDTVTVGDQGRLDGIQGDLKVRNPREFFGPFFQNSPGFTDLIVDGSNDTGNRTVSLNDFAIGGLAPATIFYEQEGIRSLTVNGGGSNLGGNIFTSGNIYTVSDTPQNSDGTLLVSLNTGTGMDEVNLLRSSSTLRVNANAGLDTVNIADATHNLDGIHNLTVSGGTGTGTTLNVDDEANASKTQGGVLYQSSPTYLITDSQVMRTNLVTPRDPGTLQPIGPPRITVASITYGNVSFVRLTGGSSGNVFNVDSTVPGTSTTIKAGIGKDTVNAGSTYHLLRDIGTLTVTGNTGTTLLLDDRYNQNIIMQDPDVDRLGQENLSTAPKYVVTDALVGRTDRVITTDSKTDAVQSDHLYSTTISYSNLASLTIDGGTSGNAFTVHGTRANTPVTIDTGSGTNTVQVTPVSQDLSNLKGDLTIKVAVPGQTTVFLHDRNNPGTPGSLVKDSYRITAGGLCIGDPVNVNLSNVAALILDGAASAAYDIEGVPAGTAVTINPGPGPNSFNLPALAQPPAGLTLNTAGTDLVLDDSGNSANTTYTITATTVEAGILPPIPYTGFHSLSLLGGNGNDQFLVKGTAAGVPLTLNGGTRYNEFDVYGANPLPGSLTLHGRGSSGLSYSALQFYDLDNPAAENYTLSAGPVYASGTLTRTNAAGQSDLGPLAYDGMYVVNLDTSNGSGTTVQVPSVAAGLFVQIGIGTGENGTPGTTQVTVGHPVVGGGGTVQDILSAVGIGTFYPTGMVQVVVDDSGDTVGRQATFNNNPQTAHGVDGLAPARIWWNFPYKPGSTVTVLGGTGNDTFLVQNSAAGVPLTISAGAGDDSFQVGDATHSLAGLQAALTLDGGSGHNTLTLDDSASPTSPHWQNYDLGIDHFDRQGSPSVLFSHMAGITLTVGHGGLDGNSVGVSGTAAGAPVTLNGAPGTRDYFVVNATLDAIHSPVTMHEQRTDIDIAAFYDFHNAAAHQYTMTADTVSRDGQAQVLFDGLYQMTLWASNVGGNTINIEGVALQGSANVVAANGDHVTVGRNGSLAAILGLVEVHGGATDTNPQVTLLVDDSNNPNTAPRQVTFVKDAHGIGVYGLTLPAFGIYWDSLGVGSSVTLRSPSGGDTFYLRTFLASTPLAIDGGGSNTLDYFAYPGDVVVNLPLGTATGVMGGIHNIQNVTPGSGNSLIVQPGGNLVVRGTGTIQVTPGSIIVTINGQQLGELFGITGSITIYGGPTDDTILVDRAITNPVTIYGNGGTDTLKGGGGTNTLVGGSGSNTFLDNGGTNVIVPGSGSNTFVPAGGTNTFVAAPDSPPLLTVTANDVTRAYGQPNPPLSARYAGFLSGDGPGSLGGILSEITPATAAALPGTYPITPAGLSSPRYTILNVLGKLTVVPAPLSATGANIDAIAGAPFNGVVATFVNADPFGNAVSYTATITWGDGRSAAGVLSGTGSTLTVSGAHTYAEPGNKTVRVQIGHKLGYTTTATTSVTATVSRLGRGVEDNQTAQAAFWHGRDGQALIRSFNGGPSDTALSTWLATNFANLYGAGAGGHNLTGNSNAQVAAFFQGLWALGKDNADVQVLTVALDVYATTASLGGAQGRAYDFRVSDAGLGACWFKVGDAGVAFGVANHTRPNVYQLLRGVNQQAVNGVLYGGNQRLQGLAEDLLHRLAEGDNEE